MSERESAMSLALQAFAIDRSSLEPGIWHSIADEAIAGSAPGTCQRF
jgi:hypothetical protein